MPVDSTLSGSDTLLGLHSVGVAHGYLMARFQRYEIRTLAVAESTILVLNRVLVCRTLRPTVEN